MVTRAEAVPDAGKRRFNRFVMDCPTKCEGGEGQRRPAQRENPRVRSIVPEEMGDEHDDRFQRGFDAGLLTLEALKTA